MKVFVLLSLQDDGDTIKAVEGVFQNESDAEVFAETQSLDKWDIEEAELA